jgi:hypothetical protein
MTLVQYRRAADAALAEYSHAARSAAEERAALNEARRAARTAAAAQKVLQAVAQSVQQSAHESIARVVTHCVRAVGWDYDFKIRFERRRGRTEAHFYFTRGGHEVDPTTAAGGGVVDVAALALRAICLVLATPKRRRFMALDEPFRGVNGRENRRRTAELVERLAADLDFQIILATGHEWLRAGKVVDL